MREPDAEPDFEITGELGRGGTAVVWLAEQVALEREVAIKRALVSADPDARARLLREAMITGQLEHPNIVPVHALLVDEDGPAVVMKRLSGSTWQALIQADELSLERHLEIFAQVANAVAFAHSRGVVHRDIKPENVILGAFGEVYLLDWGMARCAEDLPSDAIVGTPRYMAPEMASGHADARTDVFLLGACLHEVLTGQPRHPGEGALEVLYAAMNVEPFAYPDAVPDELAAICNRAMARAPEDRFASVEALREEVAIFREHRAAILLSEAACTDLATLRALIAAPSPSDAAVQHRFAQARFGFEAAREVWPDSPQAHEGLCACLRAMIDYEVDAGRPDVAQSLLERLDDGDCEREARIEALRQRLAQEAARAQANARDLDPRDGAPDRGRSFRRIALAVLALTSAALMERLGPSFRTSTRRLAVVGLVVLLAVGGILAWWRSRNDFNFINRRIAQICLATLAVSFASRVSGVLTDATVVSVLLSDAFILGLGGLALSAFHPFGGWLAGLSFAVAAVGSLWPSALELLFLALSVLVPIAFLLRRRFHPEPTGAFDAGLSR